MNTTEGVAHLILRVARLLTPQIQARVNAAYARLDAQQSELETKQREIETKQRELERAAPSTEDSIQPDKELDGLDHPPDVRELVERCDVAMREVDVAMEDASRIMRLARSAMALASPVIAQQQRSNEELAVPVADLPEIVAMFASLVAALESLVVERPEGAASD